AAIFSRSPGENVDAKIRRPDAPPTFDENGRALPGPPDAVTTATIIEVQVPLGRRDQLESAQKAKIEARLKALEQQSQQARGQVPQQDGAGVAVPDPNAPPAQVSAPVVHNTIVRPLDAAVLSNAWSAYVRRVGIPGVETALSATDGAKVLWEDPAANAAIGR